MSRRQTPRAHLCVLQSDQTHDRCSPRTYLTPAGLNPKIPRALCLPNWPATCLTSHCKAIPPEEGLVWFCYHKTCSLDLLPVIPIPHENVQASLAFGQLNYISSAPSPTQKGHNFFFPHWINVLMCEFWSSWSCFSCTEKQQEEVVLGTCG